MTGMWPELDDGLLAPEGCRLLAETGEGLVVGVSGVPLTEIWHSREGQKTARSVFFTRIFEGFKSYCSEDVGGWSAVGLPTEGDEYPFCAWGSMVTPRCVSVRVDPRFTNYKARAVVTYAAPRVLGD